MRDVVGSLAVKQCPHCNWMGQVNDIESHGNTCMFKIVTCDVEGCNHTCQRKDMGDHTSDTNVKFKHMELKHDKKLKEMEKKHKDAMTEMEEKNERKLAQQKAETQNKLQTYERRIRALEIRKRSAEDMSNNNSVTPDEMIVEGCGVSSVNGTYRRQGSHDGAPMYFHSALYGGQDAVFTLYRYGLRWYISIISGDEPSSKFEFDDTDFYSVRSEDSLPPRTGWLGPILSNHWGVDPPPTIRTS